MSIESKAQLRQQFLVRCSNDPPPHISPIPVINCAIIIYGFSFLLIDPSVRC